MRARPATGRLALWAILALAVALLPAGRLLVQSRHNLARADAALAEGRTREARVHLERCARGYFPGNGYAREAMSRLEGLAAEWEEEGEAALALSAFESRRGAALATGALTMKSPPEERVRERLASLRALFRRTWPAETGGSGDHGEDVARSFDRPRDPRALPSLLAFASLGAAALLVAVAARLWGEGRGAGSGLLCYGAALPLLALALFLLSLA